jgi:hypothetical protein
MWIHQNGDDDTLGHVTYRCHVFKFYFTKIWNYFIIIWYFNSYIVFIVILTCVDIVFSSGTYEDNWIQPNKVVK